MSETIRAAKIAAIAAICGALIGAGLTAAPTFFTIRAEDSRATAEFIRTQQQSAYAQFSVDEASLRDAMYKYFTSAYPRYGADSEHRMTPGGPPVMSDEVATLRNDAKNKALTLFKADSVVVLIGSQKTARIADQIYYQHNQARHALNRAITKGSDADFATAADLFQSAQEATVDFIESARADFGVEPGVRR